MINVRTCPYKSIVVETDEEELLTISEGARIKFATLDGELKEGIVVTFKGSKPEKVEIEIIPLGKEHKETWPVTSINDDSLKLVKTDEETDNEEDDYEE